MSQDQTTLIVSLLQIVFGCLFLGAWTFALLEMASSLKSIALSLRGLSNQEMADAISWLAKTIHRATANSHQINIKEKQ